MSNLIRSAQATRFYQAFLGMVAVIAAIFITNPFGTDCFAATRWQKKVKRLVKSDNQEMKKLGKSCFQKKMLKNGAVQCDFDGDHFTNFREQNLPRLNGKRVRINFRKLDTDGDGLTDWEELMIYGTNPKLTDTDGDGISDGDEINNTNSDPLNPDSDGDGIPDGQQYQTGGACPGPNFDSAGNTNKFGIPAGSSGNITRGQTLYTSTCGVCHRAEERGTNLTYTQLNAALTGQTGTPMNFHLPTQSLADLAAFLNRTQLGGDGNCPTPTPPPPGGNNGGGTPTPTPTSSATPTPTPCTGGSVSNFDSQGNTTAFSIPTPVVGNITQGQTQYNATCITCHLPASGEKGTGLDFVQLRAAFTNNLFMNGTISGPVVLNDQQVANLAAFLNRANTGSCTGGPTPTPTPTPDPVARGAAIFAAACISCHTISASGNVHEMDRHPSLNKIHEALRTGPDEMPRFWELTLGASAPPYSQSEQDLWAYLHSLP